MPSRSYSEVDEFSVPIHQISARRGLPARAGHRLRRRSSDGPVGSGGSGEQPSKERARWTAALGSYLHYGHTQFWQWPPRRRR